MMKCDKIIEYVHIPKCGGWTIYQHFKDLFGEEKIADVTYDPIPGTFSIEDTNIIIGHRSSDFFDQIQNHNQYKPFRFTLVRDPAERLWSYYRYLARTTRLPPHKWMSRMGFRTFCERVLAMKAYHDPIKDQATMFSGHEAFQVQYITGLRWPTKDQIIQALDTKFNIVAPIHLIDYTLQEISELLSLPYNPAEHLNADEPQKPYTLDTHMSEEDITFIRDKFSLDYFLYELVCERYNAHDPSA